MYFPRRIQAVLMVIIAIMLNLSLPVFAQQADVFLEYPQPISPTQQTAVVLKFPYGSIFKDRDVRNTSVSVSIRGEAFAIVSDQVKDQYYTTTIEQEGNTYPKPWNCEGKFEGEEHLVDKKLVTTTSISRYGAQTAQKNQDPSGEETAVLKARHTGCLVVPIQLTAKAKPGDFVQVQFNPNILDSQDYSILTKPGIQTVQLVVQSSETCSDGEEFIAGRCRKMCAKNQIRDIELHECKMFQLNCKTGQEIFNNACVPKCQENMQRDLSGQCVLPAGYICTDESCTQSTACSGSQCVNAKNNWKLGEAESRILIMLIITVLLTTAIFLVVLTLKRVRSFKNANSIRTPHDNYPPDTIV